MKAVILPTADTEALAPLTSWLPEFLLPVVNKPIAAHLIELLVQHELKEILLILKHMPFETEAYFGDGSRWGVNLSYSLIGTYRGVANALGHLDESRFEEPFLCLPGDVVADLDLSSFVKTGTGQRGEVFLARTSVGSHEAGLETLSREDLAVLDANPFIMTPEAFTLTKRLQPPSDPLEVCRVPSSLTLSVKVCEVAGKLERIQSPVDLLKLNQRVLAGDFPGLIVPGRMAGEGIWVGRHTRIHPGVRLEAPMILGDHCNIQSGAVLGPGCVIGNQVIVDEGASVQDSLVLDRTYVGPHTDLRAVIVNKNWMLQVPSLLSVHLGDDLILGDLEKKTVTARGDRLLNLLLSLVLLVLTAPLAMVLYLYHLVHPSRQYFYSEKRFGAFDQKDFDGKLFARTFHLYAFRSSNRLVRKLPGLVNVIRGEMSLVGTSALDEGELRELPEEWRGMRASAPVGLFHLWELDPRQDLEWEEKMVIENYHAASRSLWGDLKILGRGLLVTAFK